MSRPRATHPGEIAQAVISLDLWGVSWGFEPTPAALLAGHLGCSEQAVRQARSRWWPEAWRQGEVPRLGGPWEDLGGPEDLSEHNAARALAMGHKEQL